MNFDLIQKALLLGSANVKPQDVFHISTRSGNGSTATVTSGFGPFLSITKARSTSTGWRWVSTAGESIESNSTTAKATEATGVTAFTSTGLALGADADYNASGQTFVDYLFAYAEGFATRVEYTGDGTTGRSIPHDLNAPPGMTVVKRLDSAGQWTVRHRSSAGELVLNTTAAQTSSHGRITAMDSSTFTVSSDAAVNASGGTYASYIFAQNPDLIDFGIYTGNGSSTGPSVVCGDGWTPQWVLIRRTDTDGLGWYVHDSSRAGYDALIDLGSAGAEAALNVIDTIPSGFKLVGSQSGYNGLGGQYVYMAIRAEY
ncbi:hypothetical protein [Aurantimonas coralicida]|uniref:DUF7483 domain-containing protein n=1 Tax=Aurantimonas coralicida TaxID=182270 RepID=UPI001E620A81|nr:hypothetical protein [Aurantimonas coralicida]MCD1644160.1 hypothetical protein [Aurantimonas coralicida]